MIGRFAWLLPVLLLACEERDPRFVAADVWVDAGDAALAAYQFELVCETATIVGIAGGDGSFEEPPYYDTAALRGGKIVIAAFTTDQDVARGRVRVAQLQLLEAGSDVVYEPRLVTAAKPGGERIEARIEIAPIGENK